MPLFCVCIFCLPSCSCLFSSLDLSFRVPVGLCSVCLLPVSCLCGVPRGSVYNNRMCYGETPKASTRHACCLCILCLWRLEGGGASEVEIFPSFDLLLVGALFSVEGGFLFLFPPPPSQNGMFLFCVCCNAFVWSRVPLLKVVFFVHSFVRSKCLECLLVS